MVTAALPPRTELVYTTTIRAECECRDCSATGAQSPSGITVNPGQPLTQWVHQRRFGCDNSCTSSDVIAT